MRVLNWKIGAVGAYLDPANWVEGVAPGPGDTANIPGGSGPEFYPPDVDPDFLSGLGEPAPPGDTIAGETINFTPVASTNVLPQLSNTTFAANTALNVAGPGTQNIEAWYNSNFEGVVNVGIANTPGSLEITLVHKPTSLPHTLTTNTGTIAIAGDSLLHLAPFYDAPLFDGLTDFDNQGTITVAPGGELAEFGALGDQGPYPWTFINNGNINVQGGGDKITVALLEANLTGNGTIALDGGNSSNPRSTQLQLSGNVGGGTVALRDASLVVYDAGPTQVNGGTIAFKDGHSFLLLTPGLDPAPHNLLDPFQIPITGFRTGDTIALQHANVSFYTPTYSYHWDQPTHQLTIFKTPAFASTFELARLTLLGNYGPNDFTLVDNTSFPIGPGAVNTQYQLDIMVKPAPGNIFFQNDEGSVALWQLRDPNIVGGGAVGTNPGPSWHIKSNGDFNGDGSADLLWQNSSGDVAIWELSGASVISSAGLGNSGPSWHAVATGDFNRDGNSDILWQNDNGTVAIWEMNGTNLIGGAIVANPGPDWHAIGSGDFNGDGFSDVLLQNSSGEVFVWELNGTSLIGTASLGNPGPSWHAVGTGDFNDDGRSDILWQNDDGTVAVWELNGTSVIGAAVVANPGPSWHAVGTGDYNGDGFSDIRFQNTSGEVAIWEMSGTSIAASGSLGNPGPSWHVTGDSSPFAADNADLLWQTDRTAIGFENDSGQAAFWFMNGTTLAGAGAPGDPGPTWHIKAIGDFEGAGNLDLLWQNDSGEAAIWKTNGSSLLGGGSIGNPGPSWHIIGVGDFNHDGRSDILWQNDSGEAAIWGMNGTTVIGAASLGNPGPSWHVKGTGDFNGDGFSDVLWQNDDGSVAVWEMNGATTIGAAVVGNPGPSWHALGTGDFNGDGRADILWQNDSGEAAIWQMNGTNVIGAASIGNPGPDWHILGTGDYNNDGKSDILWQNSSGAVAIWEMNGTTPIAAATITNPGPTWHA